MTKEDGLVAIFDLDNTLIDSGSKLRADFVGAMQRLGITMTPEEIRAGDWYKTAAKYGIPKEVFDKSFDQRKTWEQSLRDGEAPLFEDTLPCLETLASRGIRMGLLSKSIPEYTQVKLDYHNLGRYFEQVVTVHPKIPNKIEGALEIMNKLGGEIIRAWFIGDKAEDVVIAREVFENKPDYGSDTFFDTYGIYLNRNGLPIPQEVERYHKVKSLGEIPLLIR